jgi:hypothetical protein
MLEDLAMALLALSVLALPMALAWLLIDRAK